MDSSQDIYASLATRVKASIIDGFVLLTLFIMVPVTIGTFISSESPFKGVAMFAPILLLEPLLVTYVGATIGQSIFGLKVIRVNTRSNCNLFISFFRYLAKTVLGSLSLIYMLFSKKHQAIHDHLANTVVIISQKKLNKNPQLMKYGETEQTLNYDYIYPSAIRRFISFIGWYAFVGIVLVTASDMVATRLIPGYPQNSDKLPEIFDNSLSIALAIIFISLAVFASKGLLPGARKKKSEKSNETNAQKAVCPLTPPDRQSKESWDAKE